MASDSPILVIDRGDLPSLVATSLEPDPEHLILWHQMETDRAAERRRSVCEIKARSMGVRRLIISRPPVIGLPDMAAPGELYQAMLLLQASALARQLNCRRIVWPRHSGPDFEKMGPLVERANLVSALAGDLKAGSGPVIDLPIVDLTDEQLVDALEGSGSPLDLFWPCETGDSSPCGACGGCCRWHEAFEAMGLAWPWAALSVG